MPAIPRVVQEIRVSPQSSPWGRVQADRCAAPSTLASTIAAIPVRMSFLGIRTSTRLAPGPTLSVHHVMIECLVGHEPLSCAPTRLTVAS